MVETFTDLINAVVDKRDVFTVGTVTSVDEAEMTWTVTPEGEGQDIEDVPLRIMRYADAVGFTVIPAVGTEAIVLWLGRGRPLIFRVHKWDKIIVQNKEGHGLIIESGEVLLGVESRATHPVAWADTLATYLTTMQAVIVGLGGVLGPVPNIASAEVKVS
jgi:hypothetical protein